MNLTELIAAARLELDDFDDGIDSRDLLWSDEELVRWANQAQEEAALRAYLLFDDSSPLTQISINTTDSVYSVSPRIIRLVNARILNNILPHLISKNKGKLDERDPFWGTRVGNPTSYVNYDGLIKLDKIPNVAGTIQLDAYVLPEPMVLGGNEVLDIDTHHHESLLFWIKHRAYEKQDTETLNPELSAINANKFTSRFGRKRSAAEDVVLRRSRPSRVRAKFF